LKQKGRRGKISNTLPYASRNHLTHTAPAIQFPRTRATRVAIDQSKQTKTGKKTAIDAKQEHY